MLGNGDIDEYIVATVWAADFERSHTVHAGGIDIFHNATVTLLAIEWH